MCVQQYGSMKWTSNNSVKRVTRDNVSGLLYFLCLRHRTSGHEAAGDCLSLVVAPDKFSQLVSWCFEPSQPRRITSALNTNFTLSPSYSFHKSSYHKSWGFFLAYLYSVDTQHGNLHPAGRPILFSDLHRNRCQPQPTQEQIGRGFEINDQRRDLSTRTAVLVSASTVMMWLCY